MSQSHIRIRGARTHNLKNVNLDIPRDKFVVITGLSGSGKSSLVFRTVAAESEQLLNESYSSYIQFHLNQQPKPKVKEIKTFL